MTLASTYSKLKELIFVVEDDREGGYIAQSLGEDIFTQADDLDTLKSMIRDAIDCHFLDPAEKPQIVRLHIVRDEVMAL
ncbi:MAG: 2-oxoisovalerate dehydrogenase [Prochlorotrichaceae cyanobacterium]